MRIGLMRQVVEIWDTKKTQGEFGQVIENKDLHLRCYAAIKDISNEITTSGSTRSIKRTIQITIKFNRYFQNPTSTMYVVFDGVEYDITTPPNNSWQLNKYVTFNAVSRN